MAKYYGTTLQKGSQGDDVKEWQSFLKSQGYDVKVDGIFGDETGRYTRSYQMSNGLQVDGIVGKNTWGKAGYTNSSTGNKATGKSTTSAPAKPTFNNTATAKPTVGALPTQAKYDTTSWDDTKKGQAALGDYNSAKDAVNNYGDFTYDDYVMGKDAQAAKDALDAHLANKPGEYSSQWQAQLDELMGQIMNRDKFSYDLNGDALYQQYKDKYIQQGKLAMADTMGQAAAMTGGYGSSYAQSVGQQAYQGQLDNLNDIVPQLYQMAYDRYNQEGQDLYNQYGLVMDRENQDYGRHRDKVADWQTDRGYLDGAYRDERTFDYGKYIDDRNLDYTLHQEGYQRLMDALGIAQSDYYDGANMFHTEQSNKNSVASQQFNDAMNLWNAKTDQAWKEYQAAEDARQYANSLLQQGYENDFGKWRADTEDSQWQKQYDESVRQYNEQMAFQKQQYADSKASSGGSGGGSGGSGGSGSGSGSNSGGGTYTKTLWNATGTRDDNGNYVFRNSEGKTQAFGKGINPYTGTKHSDAKYGTFSNGYQPNNIGGAKLSKAKDKNGLPISTNITGKNQSIWTVNGRYYLWRGDLNRYEEVDISDID